MRNEKRDVEDAVPYKMRDVRNKKRDVEGAVPYKIRRKKTMDYGTSGTSSPTKYEGEKINENTGKIKEVRVF